MPVWCDGIITKRTVWTAGLFTIRVRVPDLLPFDPGQFLQLGIHHQAPEDTEAKLINRPYSVASPHGDEVEFFIVVVEDGQLTPKLWNLAEGDTLQVSQRAAGSFTLQKSPPARDLWLMATGTGLAPYIAMLRDSFLWQNYQRIFLVHGVRWARDLAYSEELKSLADSHPDRLVVLQTLTRETVDGYLTGRISDLIEDGRLERTAGATIHGNDSTVLLCGNPDMLDSMEQILADRQMRLHRSKSPGHIVLERYW